MGGLRCRTRELRAVDGALAYLGSPPGGRIGRPNLSDRRRVSKAAHHGHDLGIHNNQTSVDPVADDAVRIGWDEMGDLSELEATRDAFKAATAERMPQIDEASIPNQAGTVYRFVHAMKVGDIVVCPDRRTSTLNIGRVSGPYEFHPESDVHKRACDLGNITGQGRTASPVGSRPRRSAAIQDPGRARASRPDRVEAGIAS
jgi:hypothetical protein